MGPDTIFGHAESLNGNLRRRKSFFAVFPSGVTVMRVARMYMRSVCTDRPAGSGEEFCTPFIIGGL